MRVWMHETGITMCCSYWQWLGLEWGFPGGASGKEHACQCRRHKRHGFDPWVRKIPGGGHGNPLQYSCLGSSMDRGAWRATGHGATERLSHDMT